MSRQMQGAPTGIHPSQGISLNTAIRAGKGPRSSLGSCNGCTNGRYELNDKGEPLVMEVTLRQLTFRLCANCAQLLKGQL